MYCLRNILRRNEEIVLNILKMIYLKLFLRKSIRKRIRVTIFRITFQCSDWLGDIGNLKIK